MKRIASGDIISTEQTCFLCGSLASVGCFLYECYVSYNLLKVKLIQVFRSQAVLRCVLRLRSAVVHKRFTRVAHPYEG